MEEPMENWKQFQGTELGSLMSQIYGNQNKPIIKYPVPKKNKIVQPPKEFIPGGAKLTSSDPRKSTKKNVDLKVPKYSKKSDFENMKPIDLIVRRRNSELIRREIDDIQMRQSHYRPAHTKDISSDLEKEKLNQIFSYKGGKGLPQELTLPVSEAPFEIQARKKEKERIQSIREKKGLFKKTPLAPVKPLSENEQFAQQISMEIEERRNYLEEMREYGLSKYEEKNIKDDIARKLLELKRYENPK